MAGPALHNHDSHHAIHEGALDEARRLTELLEKLVADKREKDANEVADALIEHWETRILAHAEAEEQGFYQSFVDRDPGMYDQVTRLIRDHDILRKIAKALREKMAEDGLTFEVLGRFHALIYVNEIHSRDEEATLLAKSREKQ